MTMFFGTTDLENYKPSNCVNAGSRPDQNGSHMRGSLATIHIDSLERHSQLSGWADPVPPFSYTHGFYI